jgi:hypothetical protein
MPGVWLKPLGGCPHLHRQQDSVDLCDMLHLSPCVFETYKALEGCETFREILQEWEEMDAEGLLYQYEAEEMQR